jgi:hypothetical protein
VGTTHGGPGKGGGGGAGGGGAHLPPCSTPVQNGALMVAGTELFKQQRSPSAPAVVWLGLGGTYVQAQQWESATQYNWHARADAL